VAVVRGQAHRTGRVRDNLLLLRTREHTMAQHEQRRNNDCDYNTMSPAQSEHRSSTEDVPPMSPDR
jgi:hypothetical protein